MIANFDDLLRSAGSVDSSRVVVAGVTNPATLEAVYEAWKDGLIHPLFVDNAQALQRELRKGSPGETADSIETGEDPAEVAGRAVQAIRDGAGDILMKGSIPTADLMRAVVDRHRGIRGEGLLSDSFLFEHLRRPGNQLINITDGGVVLYPDVDQKQRILENAVKVSQVLGNRSPLVAVCAAVEKVTEKMPPTTDAQELTRRYQRGEISGCVVDGPLALDGALSKESLEMKQIHSPLEGKADILVMPDIDAANLVAKSTQYIAGKEAAHVIMGAAVPVLIPSRSDSARGKYLSLALASVIRSGQTNN